MVTDIYQQMPETRLRSYFAVVGVVSATRPLAHEEVMKMSKKHPMVFVSHMPGDRWKVKSTDSTRADSIHERKSDAHERGRELAENKKAELVIQNREGKIVEKDSFGPDPRKSKG